MTGMDAIYNKRLVRRYLACFYHHSAELATVCHPHVQLHYRSHVLADGITAMIRYAQQESACFNELMLDVQQIIVDGFAASARIMERGIQQADWRGIACQGLPFSIEQMLFFDIEAQKISHVWAMWDFELKRAQLS